VKPNAARAAVVPRCGFQRAAKLNTLQGVVPFDQDGDIQDRTISVFQIRKDATKPLDDVDAQYKYAGNALQS
jgi:branched-chain amino acid transport system substrate-binding protein